jgi:hypothetical protein
MVMLSPAQYDSALRARKQANATPKSNAAAPGTTKARPAVPKQPKSTAKKPAKVRPDTAI